MSAAMPCKIQREKHRETCRVEKKCKTKYACIVEAGGSTRKRMEGSLHKNHEDHIAGTGMDSLSHYNLLHKFRKTSKKCKHVETRSKTKDFKSKLACILGASESTRLRMEESLPNHHEDHIAGKGNNSLQHYNLVHKFIPVPQAMKIPAAKAAVDKEWEKLEKIPA